MVGLMILLGGIGGVSIGWTLGGAIVLGIAGIIARRAPASS